jgi:uncharacterized protein (DUF1697 family)
MRRVALLRAINVGGHTVKMDRLRALFTELGFGDVATLIASGNVMFDDAARDDAALEARIQAHLAGSLGYDVATFIRRGPELAAAAAHDTIRDDGTLYIGFLRSAPSAESAGAIAALSTDSDELTVHGRELYWRARDGIGRSKITGARLEKLLGGPLTLRNVNTVEKLAALVT